MARNIRRTSVWSGLALAAATLMAALPAAAAVEPASEAPPTPIPVAESHGFVLDKGRVTTFDAPGAFTTQAWDITNTGQVIGQYYDSDGEQHGFVRDRRGQISTVDFPGEDGSLNESIGGNDRGEIVGSHGNYDPENGELQAYVRDRRGSFATHDVPGALVTGAFKNNNRGQVVGAYSVESRRVPIRAYRGHLFEDDKFTPIDAPGATYTAGIDINDRGQMIGIGVVPDARVGFGFGFLRDRDGSYSRLPDVPGAAQTVPFGINNRGQIVGAYASLSAAGTPVIRGMMLRDGEFTLIDVPGAELTQVTGINDRGQMVGFYVDADESPAAPALAAEQPGDAMPTLQGLMSWPVIHPEHRWQRTSL